MGERVQLLIGQSTLQIQEQSTLGTMQQSSLQHYSVLGRLTRVVQRKYGQDWWRVHWSVRSSTELQQDLVQASTASCRLLGGSSRRLHQLISRSMLITRKKKKKWDSNSNSMKLNLKSK